VPDGGIARRALDLAGVPPLLTFHESRLAGIASAEARSKRREQRRGTSGLSAVTAKIEDLAAKTEAERAQVVADAAGVTVIRARIADPGPGTRAAAEDELAA
jgi:hypothetical protein